MPSAGTILDDRFVIEAPIGTGGMGAVFRALDRRSGRVVAVKIMRAQTGAGGHDAARFASEIAVLAELSHPAIVGFVAHGTTDDGRPYLAMEHLEGEDLETRLARGPLPFEDALALIRRVAGALAEPHRRGIVHRDLKPSNLFLRDGAPERVTVLDFGVARRSGAGTLTAAGVAIGTPEYMAPEQAQGARDVGPAADVFALGCVLYRCITGVSPFAADHVAATLAKILFEDPPSVERARPGVPSAVGGLLRHMLARRADARIADAGALIEALASVAAQVSQASIGARAARGGPSADDTLSSREPPATRLAGLGGTELELVSVILAAPPEHPARSSRLEPDERDALRATEPADATLAAGTTSFADQAILVVRGAVSLPGLAIERLADGSIVAALGQLGESAADQALAAARGARALRAAFPGARVAIATAKRLAGARGAMGEALDRAGRLLPREGASTGVLLDEVTAGLLDGRVRTVLLARGVASLHDEPTPVDETRLLLGKPTPCVGREHELGTLEATLRASFDDDVSRAVLVVAPPGVGKSRLRHELLRRHSAREALDAQPSESRESSTQAALLLEARGELLRAGSPYGLLAPALRRAFGIGIGATGVTGATGAAGDSPDEARAKLVEGVRRWCEIDATAADPIASLLGELCDVPFAEEGRPELGAVRQDPRLLHARLGDALVALLGGHGRRRPRLVVIEDLHWGDRPSIDLLGRALRELEDRPLFVVAFARPELSELAPELWQGRVMELPLRPLGRRACERLVERVAGAQLDAPTIARVVEQSAGNALFLEELLRSAIEDAAPGERGERDERGARPAPATVLAMLQTRIGRLDTRERRVLRAASVFGETFHLDGVRALLGAAPERDQDAAIAERAELAADLAQLTRREVVEPLRRESAGAAGLEAAYRFRHALMRDAAYGLLTDDDRRLGHRLAATWLTDREPDPLPIAEHWLRADADVEAAPWLLRAAERAIERDDFAAAERLAKRGRALATTTSATSATSATSVTSVTSATDARALAGEFAAIEAIAAVMRWGYSTVAEAASFALEHTTEGSRGWIRALRSAATVAAFGQREAVDPYVTRILAVKPAPEVQLIYGDALLHIASAAAQTGLPGQAATMLTRAEVELADALVRFPALRAWRNVIRCTLHRHTDDDLATQRLLLQEALRLYELVSASKTMIMLARDVLGEVASRAGQHDDAESLVRQALETAQRSGLGYVVSHARLALANVLVAHPERSRHAEAEQHARELLAMPGASAGYRAMSLDVIAQTSLSRDALDEAEAAAREAIGLSAHTPVRRWLMVAHLAEALVRKGRAAEAHAVASEALAELEAAGGGGYAELALLLSAGEAAWAAGDRARAAALARRARQRIVRQAGAFVDREAFARFLKFAPGVERLRALEASGGAGAG